MALSFGGSPESSVISGSRQKAGSATVCEQLEQMITCLNNSSAMMPSEGRTARVVYI